MNKTKIDWCDSTWNPVTGCYHECEYCYARKIATRFDGGYVSGGESRGNYCLSDKAAQHIAHPEIHDGHILMTQHKPIFENIGILDRENKKYSAYPFGFCPTIHRQRLDEPAHKTKGGTIFVGSMADLFGDWVPDEWIREVFKACEAAPQHRYLFLTKNPKRYEELWSKGVLPKNHWYGHTITNESVSAYASTWNPTGYNNFLSIEPLLGNAAKGNWLHLYKWVIIGAETGNRKSKVIPKREWIEDIVGACRSAGVPVFMKDSLRGIMGDDFVQEYPWN